MTAFSDADIQRLLGLGQLQILPFTEAQLTPNGYDLAIAEIQVPAKGLRVTEGTATVPPGTRFLVSTRERVELGETLVGELWLRTTWARRGVLASFGKVDAGFRGTLTLAAFNASHEPLGVPIGETFAQVVFTPLASPASRTYGERSGNYLNQQGIVVK
ncbi:MAG TPA: dCTP deaminase [Thermoplasmata archaeon]|nr:dCTP deaminase [Thermoplasmata archaeon]